MEKLMSSAKSWKTVFLLAVAVSCSAICASAQEAHAWGYSGAHGPDHWPEVSAICGTGKAQSPINIVPPKKSDLPRLNFSYQRSPLNVVNNGHTIQDNYAAGSSVTLDGKTYDLLQVHFHHHSETAIKGEHTPMEAHLVHKDKDGNLLVVAVLLKEGRANSTVGTLWKNIGGEEGKANAPPGVTVDAANLLPEKREYYTFPGSLTTPPCSEGVKWVVMTHPMTVSKEQIEAFAKLYPDNARPVQPLNGRTVLESK
jgi:carbonic anhydrase